MSSPADRFPVLPIEAVLPELLHALGASPNVVLQAPPGAGKTTRVPLALLGAEWLGTRRMLMLEPRRIAARAAARRMAITLGESVGATVGFRVRGESRVSAATRVEVVTEGILTRMLLDDPSLDGVGALLFDEFHERSLNADVGLALALQAQEVLRPDLRILVMSATLDGAATSALLGDAPIVTSEGRRFPVEIHWRARHATQRIEDAVAHAVRHAIANDEGSILAFLPGAAEIRRCASLLRADLPNDVRVLPLFGDLPAAAQDEAIAPPPAGVRKVVLATSIAETSLTIEGVRVVVDSGLARVPRFSPRSGMTRLETVRVSHASAVQRSGRAGRTAPGVSYRLWSRDEDAHLLERSRPEILETDLAPLALDLALAGVADPSELRWLDAPPPAAMSQARELLRLLGALDADHRITPHGRRMSEVGIHPRLAHMLVTAAARGAAATACVVAALLEERDPFRRDGAARDVDIRSRVALFVDGERAHSAQVDADAMRRVREQVRLLRARAGVASVERVNLDLTGALVAVAYPDRVAQRRGSGIGARYLLRNGTGAELRDGGSLSRESYLAVADLDGRSPHASVYLAAALDEGEIREWFAEDIVNEEIVRWDTDADAVVAVRRERLGAIVLRERALHAPDVTLIANAVRDAIESGVVRLTWSDSAQALRDRIAFLRTIDASWPDVSDDALRTSFDEWLVPHLSGVRRRADVERLPLQDLLLEMLGWERRRQLDLLAPTHVDVPSGSRIPIDYADPESPVLAVRLQEMFGLADTPRVGGGRVPLTLHLLSPAHRPVQVTRDLGGFWRSSYHDVRKDLRGRYPRHPWPEDPLQAQATRRAKPRGE